MSPHLVEYDGKRRALRIGSPASLAILSAGAIGALSFYGGGAITSAAAGGGATEAVQAPPTGEAPLAPTVTGVAVSDTSFYVLGSTFSGDGSHSATLFEVDTVGGAFTTSDTLAETNLTRSDTIFNSDLNNIALDSGAVLIARAHYTNEFGTSSFGAVDTFTVVLGGVATIFASEWEQLYTTPTFLEAVEQQQAGVWNDYSSSNAAPAVFVQVSDSGLTNRGDYLRIYNSGTSARQLHHRPLINASEDHWGRVYIRSNQSTSRHNHFMNMGDNAGSISFGMIPSSCSGSAALMVNLFERGAGDDRRFTIADVDNTNDEDCFTLDEWYMVEWAVDFDSDTTFQVDIWVHEVDSTGTITTEDKWTASDFYGNDLPGTGRTVAQVNLPDSAYSGTPQSVTDLRAYTIGNEGPSGGTTDAGYFDVASFAISNVGRLRDQAVTTGTTR